MVEPGIVQPSEPPAVPPPILPRRFRVERIMPEHPVLPKSFFALLLYNAVIWAILLVVIGWTIGGDPLWLGGLGIGGAGLTSWAGWFGGKGRDNDLAELAPVAPPAAPLNPA